MFLTNIGDGESTTKNAFIKNLFFQETTKQILCERNRLNPPGVQSVHFIRYTCKLECNKYHLSKD